MSTTSTDALRAAFEAAGQGHVFSHWDQLDAAGRARLSAELEAVDLTLIGQLAAELGRSDGAKSPALTPPDVFPLERDGDHAKRADAARQRGAELLAAGKVGFVLVAGGQGSRLGFDGPKGAYEIGPVTNRSLFSWHAERIRAAGARHGFEPTWYIMTSAANDAATKAFFAEHGHFGLAVERVVFFSQDMLPALDTNGKIILAGTDALFLAPNGHGGTLAALRSSGALDHMREHGIEQLSYFQVDNPLARPADTLFVGLHDLEGAEMSSKVVAKRDAGEKVGVLGNVDGILGCIEYSDLSDELRTAAASSGDLLFNAGNIAVHAIRRDFVESLTEGGNLDLPWHIARKQIATIDGAGAAIKVDGVKFETFVFDALGRTSKSVVLEVAREEEFSPVKNAEGSDSPATCRADLTRIGAGIIGQTAAAIEVAPTAAESPDEFSARGPAIRTESNGLVVGD